MSWTEGGIFRALVEALFFNLSKPSDVMSRIPRGTGTALHSLTTTPDPFGFHVTYRFAWWLPATAVSLCLFFLSHLLCPKRALPQNDHLARALRRPVPVRLGCLYDDGTAPWHLHHARLFRVMSCRATSASMPENACRCKELSPPTPSTRASSTPGGPQAPPDGFDTVQRVSWTGRVYLDSGRSFTFSPQGRFITRSQKEGWLDPWQAHLQRIGVRIRTNVAVTAIEEDDARVLVRCANGDCVYATRVVYTNWDTRLAGAEPPERMRRAAQKPLRERHRPHERQRTFQLRGTSWAILARPWS